MIMVDLIQEELPQSVLVETHLLKLQLNRLSRLALSTGPSNLLEDWMLQCVVQTHSEVRIEHQNLVQEVNRFGRSTWVFQLQVCSANERERVEVFKSFLVSHKTSIILIRCAYQTKNNGQLVAVVEWESLSRLLDVGRRRKWETGLARE